MTYRSLSADTREEMIEFATSLLAGVTNGEINGFCVAITFKGSRFATNIFGFCKRSPTFSRGMLAQIDDELSELGQNRRDEHTR